MATQLKKIMCDMDMSCKELQLVTGLSKNTISNYVNGHTRPHPDKAYIIADALGLHVNKVFPDLYRYSQLKKVRS